MASRHSRLEAFNNILTTLADKPGEAASLIDDAVYNDNKGNLKLRGLEAGFGVTIDVVDVDNLRFVTPETKIVISATGDIASSFLNLFVFDAPIISNGQTLFPLPFTVTDVHNVTINGLETTNWTFSLGPAALSFDDISEGYSIETTDQLLIFYKAL